MAIRPAMRSCKILPPAGAKGNEKAEEKSAIRKQTSRIVGAGLFAFTIFIRAEPGFDEWIAILEVYQYYIGVYILIGAGALVMIFSFLGCCSALMEHSSALYLQKV
uniref:Tetraspanin n=1 Tax=Anopheles christyi TaxID=43041 RepID=A0A182K0S2_9DIPT